MRNINKLLPKAFIAIVLCALALPVYANGNDGAISPKGTKAPHIEYRTVGPLKLAPNDIEVVNLSDDAGSIILSQPAHARITIEDSRRILVQPGSPGVTSLIVISRQGKIIYKRDIVVGERGDHYVRIRRMCNNGPNSGDCLARGSFYCPDGCYEVTGSAMQSSSGLTGGNSATPANGMTAYPRQDYAPPVSEDQLRPATPNPLDDGE